MFVHILIYVTDGLFRERRGDAALAKVLDDAAFAKPVIREARDGETLGVALVVEVTGFFEAGEDIVDVVRYSGTAAQLFSELTGRMSPLRQGLQCVGPQAIGFELARLSFLHHSCISLRSILKNGES